MPTAFPVSLSQWANVSSQCPREAQSRSLSYLSWWVDNSYTSFEAWSGASVLQRVLGLYSLPLSTLCTADARWGRMLIYCCIMVRCKPGHFLVLKAAAQWSDVTVSTQRTVLLCLVFTILVSIFHLPPNHVSSWVLKPAEKWENQIIFRRNRCFHIRLDQTAKEEVALLLADTNINTHSTVLLTGSSGNADSG